MFCGYVYGSWELDDLHVYRCQSAQYEFFALDEEELVGK